MSDKTVEETNYRLSISKKNRENIGGEGFFQSGIERLIPTLVEMWPKR